tara:strand:- start:254 stop:1570 length:1317 start_codon:yes stop_codon:yes gene_type:complete
VNKFLNFFLFLIVLFIVNCSFDKKTGFWTKTKKITEAEKIEYKIKEVFVEEKAFEKELNSNLKINLSAKLINQSFINNFDNNNGRVNYNGNLKNISRYKFSKIEDFNEFEPEIVFNKDNIIFFDNKGTILKFSSSSKLLWKKNYYSKSEKKLNPILFLASNNNTLIVADNVSKYYAIDINSGELLWTKNNSSPFNSQVKIFKDKFFVIDFENVLKCFSLSDGKEIWKVKTEKSFIKSQKKLSLIIINDVVYFNNSVGDISAVNINNGTLLWQTPTRSSTVIDSNIFLKTSDLIADINTILFSNNQNEFYSLDLATGVLNWKQKINSSLRPTLIDNLIFSVSQEGFLFVIEKNSGNIIRVTDIFNRFKIKKRPKIKPVGFIVGSENIYLTTNHGKLIIIDVLTGKPTSILKIDNDKISRPFVLNQNLYIIKENSVIRLN